MTTKHTSWTAKGTRIYAADGGEIAVATKADPKHRAYAEETATSIVACVNACEGINPEAVPMLYSIAENIVVGFRDKSWTMEEAARYAEAALAKARGEA